MAARKTAEEKAAEAKAAEEQKAADQAAAQETPETPVQETPETEPATSDDDGKVVEPAADDQSDDDEKEPTPENSSVDTIPAVEHSAPAVENAEEIAEKASPKAVDSEDGVAAFRPPQTRHQAWTLNTLAESEGGSELGIEQTSGNADVTKDPADRPDADAE